MNRHASVLTYIALLTLSISPDACIAQEVINAPPTVIGHRFVLHDGQTLNVLAGGQVGSDFDAGFGSVVNISGGIVGFGFDAESGSQVNISGGRVYSGFNALSGSEVRISGGSIARDFDVSPGSDVELIGGEFHLNGVEFTSAALALGIDDVFTGTLTDGSAFFFSPRAGDNFEQAVTITQSALPLLDRTPIVIDSKTGIGLSGLRAGQTLTLLSGGELSRDFTSVNALLNIDGGSVGRGLEVAGGSINIFGGNIEGIMTASAGSVVNISGGAIGRNFNANIGSEVNLSGGSIGDAFVATSGSKINVLGGTVGDHFHVFSDAEANIFGGTIGDGFRASSGGEVSIAGGTIGEDFSAGFGSVVRISGGTVGFGFNTNDHSKTELIGGDFRRNGREFHGDVITLAGGDEFTGTLVDGSTFIFTAGADDLQDVILTRAPLPALDLAPRIVQSPVVGGPSGLRAGQTLTVESGGVLRDNFAVVEATLNISGGSVGRRLEVVAGTVNLTSGTIDHDFTARSDSIVNMFGGTLGAFHAQRNSKVNVYGGTLANFFRALPGSDVELFGGEFRLNGVEFSGNRLTLAAGDVLTGTLSDGSSFVFSNLAGDDLRNVAVSEALLPPLDLTPRVVNTAFTSGPSGLRVGQTLIVQEGGALPDSSAAVDATLRVDGGVVGDGIQVVGSKVLIFSGSVGRDFDAFAGSEVSISGGNVGGFFDAESGSVVNITGGAVGSHFEAKSRSVVNISGGTVGDSLTAFSGSEVNILGGTVGSGFRARSGSIVNISGGTRGPDFDALAGSTVNLFGSQFRIDGELLDGLVAGEAFEITDRNVALYGLFADGTPFRFELQTRRFLGDLFEQGATLTVTLVIPEPSSAILLAVGGCLFWRLRRASTRRDTT